MSEADVQSTDILLPAAGITIFSNDEETLSTVQSLRDDWRFARVEVKGIEGGIVEAISTYQSEKSPDLLIIQTDNIDESFTDKLGDLSQYCEEGTSAIVIGPVNDVYLYRQMIEMGVSDYLVRPIKIEVFSEVIAKALIERLGVSGSRLIACIGSKGGVGTTSCAQISSIISSKHLGQKTMLFDLAGGWSSLSVGMGFDPSATLFEVAKAVEAKSEDSLGRMIHKVDDKLCALASGSDSMLDPSISATQCEQILDNFMSKYPVVIVDLSGADPALKKVVLSRAHHTLLVSTPTVTSLRSCRSLIKETSEIRGGDTDEISLVVNQVGYAKGSEVTVSDIAEALEFEVSASIPHLPMVFSKHEGDIKALLADKEGLEVLKPLLDILKNSISLKISNDADESDKKAGLLGGLLSKLGSK